ncbi:hypothetical protein BKA67DRAFT_564280 [Truncatella angustata]|uniref:Secreted protein n=1 Tax=Truncatella angustata TaxID=152316 RepID=A0A9P8ZYL1_9PEZI|nr:uncharacterized protein BKA67DRAFT_564280 [Truncatella angustata]KAH6654140.1 hypothetical protein BKA67DRAFT_564280 [Truncatella angustata]
MIFKNWQIYFLASFLSIGHQQTICTDEHTAKADDYSIISWLMTCSCTFSRISFCNERQSHSSEFEIRFLSDKHRMAIQ